jgi:hypothetical protein
MSSLFAKNTVQIIQLGSVARACGTIAKDLSARVLYGVVTAVALEGLTGPSPLPDPTELFSMIERSPAIRRTACSARSSAWPLLPSPTRH